MQFNFNCEQSLGCNTEGYAVLEGSFQNAIKPGYILFVNEILDSMGYASSKAQGLNTNITTASKFFISNHRIFIRAQGNSVIGILKVGVKKLFVRDERANYHEITPLCVLDFYVHESQQRGGHGKSIFEFMLNFENTQPKMLAYDRPSPKFISFLSKHYNLKDYVVQNNNFVVFHEYFEHLKLEQQSRGNRSSCKGIYGSSSLANFGQNLIQNNNNNNYSNLPSNNNSIQKPPSRGVNNMNNNQNDYHGSPITYSTPNQIFSNYFLNAQDTNSYDQIYSKKKLNLLNDYLQSGSLYPDDFIKQQIQLRGRELSQARDRVKQLESNINPNIQISTFYNKRNEYSTLFDDKKTLDKRIHPQNNNNNMGSYGQIPHDGGFNNSNNPNNLNNLNSLNKDMQIPDNNFNNNMQMNYMNPNTQFLASSKNRTPVKTNVLPTTASTYGAYYVNNNYDYNKVYYY